MSQNAANLEPKPAVVLDRDEDLLAGSLRAGMLNQLLREQLTPTKQKNASGSMVQSDTSTQLATLSSTALDAVDEILNCTQLDRTVLHDKLSQLFHQQKAIYHEIDLAPALRKHQYIAESGLILSPDNCITTQLDDLRVRAYIRAIDQAIKSLAKKQQEAIHLVYPACGPFAPLVLPLLSYYLQREMYTPQQLSVTLIDVQPGAVQTLETVAVKFGVNKFIKQILCIDALTYQPKNEKVDIVVLEAMQHGFSREGQFTIAKHFAGLLQPSGILLPEEVIINAALNDPNREYIAQWQDAEQVSNDKRDSKIIAERIALGEVARINRHTLSHCELVDIDQFNTLIKFGKVTIPELAGDSSERVLLMCSEVRVFDQEWIREYDSGITHPLPDQQVCVNFTPNDSRPGDLLVKSGETLQFFYRMNGLPGFMATHVVKE
ncbi:hypothetical protein C2869_12295 [Saccharobesus litoralis]|uniref:Uncharacterized protein n=1 Tax=Saccharobesus litoralis TaxID=2172099 RepID=A0A2S0VSJ0_9ALTE|nr:hypothetical protein [Saccharobesus litoralis]AWB67167.1 hypothetical protein C2869_12295 [Saccharobesus litoralis]